MMVQVVRRFEQPHVPFPLPLFIQRDLSQRLRFRFFRGTVERRARLEKGADILDQKAWGHGRADHGDAASLQIRQRDSCLSGGAFFHRSDLGGAPREITSEKRYIFCKVEMSIDNWNVSFV